MFSFTEKQEGTKICLDRANGAFISYDKMVISLKGGELYVTKHEVIMVLIVVILLLFLCNRYVLTLLLDSMRAVRSFSFHKAAASVLTSCVSRRIHSKNSLTLS